MISVATISQRIWMCTVGAQEHTRQDMSRYVKAFASLSWQSGQSTSALNIEALDNHLQFPIDPFDVQLHTCLQNEQWKRRYLRTWGFQNYCTIMYHLYPFLISILKPSQAPFPQVSICLSLSVVPQIFFEISQTSPL